MSVVDYDSTTIKWDSVPDLDAWGFDEYWGCEHWKAWYSALKSKYEKDLAIEKWNKSWASQNEWVDYAPNNCKYEESFMKWANTKGLTVNYTFGMRLDSGLYDVGGSLGSGVEGLAKSVGWFGRNLPWILPLGLVVVGGVYAYKFIKLAK